MGGLTATDRKETLCEGCSLDLTGSGYPRGWKLQYLIDFSGTP